MKVKVIRSARRRKTISARKSGDELLIYLPDGLSKEEEEKWIEKMKKRAENYRKKPTLKRESHEELKKKAELLNDRYFGGKLKIKSIRYVTNQNQRFGSCTTRSGAIRISHRLMEMPAWVRDYVIIHELAHLVEANHSRNFWRLVDKYKYAERAKGFLIAKEMED